MNLAHIRLLLTLPNLLSGVRFVTAPIMLYLAWNGYGLAFMAVLTVAFLSDILDGLAARLTGQVTQFGARLDTWADLATYLTIGFGTWWLWSDIVHREDLYLYGIITCYLIPAIVGMIKFGAYASYHTWGVKIAAVSIGASLYPLFLADIAWPLRVSVYIYALAAIEEVAITLCLKELKSNVGTLWHVLQQK
ncbi:CDP-alcohol phosphatidyltransferase family protein [Methyloprofundus sp.]|uniref:CDP-alcohol phosphatidyltransferase family protein n=1 Tax=Methyloprofundus sp. TaxID=2020875 RepID=UPI003D0F5176